MSKRTLIIAVIALLGGLAAFLSYKADRRAEEEMEPEPEPKQKPTKKKDDKKEPEPEKTIIPGTEQKDNNE